MGSKVTATLSAKDASDIIEILLFLKRFVANEQNQSVQRIDRVLTQKLVTADGRNLFSNRFAFLNTSGLQAAELFGEILTTLFHTPAGGQLSVENLKGASGELALKIGADNEPFGLINVGDDAKLLKLCEQCQGRFKFYGFSSPEEAPQECSEIRASRPRGVSVCVKGDGTTGKKGGHIRIREACRSFLASICIPPCNTDKSAVKSCYTLDLAMSIIFS